MFNTKLFKAHMTLKDVSNVKLSDALRLSLSTTIDRVRGRSEFRASEIQTCIKLLELNAQDVLNIFFANDVP